MASRQNISGRPRPSGVLKTVQNGGGLVNDDLAVAAGDVGGVTGPRRRQATRINPQDYPYGEPPEIRNGAPGVGISDPNDPVIEPPPVIQVPPSAPRAVPGGSRSGGGAGYRARTGNIARETTEAQTQAGQGGRFGQQHVDEYGRTRPGRNPQGVARYGGGPQGTPRWEGSAGGGGYGTIPPPIAAPPPPPEETPPEVTPEEDRPRRRRRRGGGSRGGRKQHH